MTRYLVFIIICFLLFTQEKIRGAGATFPAPVYTVWAYDYYKTKDIQLDYSAVGSGAGLRKIKAGEVDFGASDAPVSSLELRKNDLIQFPAIIGAVVPVVNIPELEGETLKLTGILLAEIFLQKISKWNDPKLQELNPGLRLPDRKILCIYRSDASGTTAIFTKYLASVNEHFKSNVGAGKRVNWPKSYIASGNQGIANYVKRLPYSISYVQSSYAVRENLNIISLKNKDGNFVGAEIDNIQMAAEFAEWSLENDFELWLVDAPGSKSWPITGASFILLNEKDKKTINDVFSFFDWCFQSGNEIAKNLKYIPIPKSLHSKIKQYIKRY